MKQVKCGSIGVMILIWAVTVFSIRAQSDGVAKTPLAKHMIKAFADAGIQMELPAVVPSESSSTNGILIMLHPTSRGEHAEQGYCIKIHARRLSKAESDSNNRMAANPLTDGFNKWYTTNHPSLDIWKTPNLWHIRKDMPTPEGLSLFIDGQVTGTTSVDQDLVEAKRIVESIKPLR